MFLRLAVVSAVQLLQDAPEVLASEMGGSAIAAAGDCIGGLCVAITCPHCTHTLHSSL